jgi:uncharacterized membrane protein
MLSNSRIEDSILIERPLAEVFAFYRDARNLPRFLGDVVAVEPLDARTSRWTIEGPLGIRVHWISVISEIEDNDHIFYETASEAFKTKWEIYFSQATSPDVTLVREVMIGVGGRLTEAALALVGKHPAAEVHSNLNRLKQLLETGQVSDRSNSISGKF